jgi:hypothetical protein
MPSPPDSVWHRCVAALVQRLSGMGLVNGRPLSVYERLTGSIDNLSFPAALVTTEGLTPTYRPVLTRVKECGFPVAVYFLDRAGRNQDEKLPNYLLLEEQLQSLAWHRLDPTVPEVWEVRPEPLPAVDTRPAFLQVPAVGDLIAGGGILRCMARVLI